MNEAKLTQHLQCGQRLALNKIMDRYTSYLSSVVWHAMGPSATAQDVEETVSDTFLTLWTHREELGKVENLKSWLAAVARNKAIDRLRRASLSPLPLEGLDLPTPSTPETDLEQRLLALQLRQAVESLEPPDDILVLRFYYEEDKLKDIAADLGLSLSAAKTRLHRARRKLKDILTKGGSANETYG